ncbi:T9SS type A sorting domain-containing protein [Flavobacterium sp. TBRC 19031]|uniref:T9SS type A sorting domain-containing protein n=1 Tax=Flavobacterium mekongense TaxID=3379707 RepID=UPI00399BE14D
MKNSKIKIILSLLIFPYVLFSQETRKVLFIGNSYTAVNNLPQIIANVAASTGDTLIFDSNTPGGNTLLQHSTNTVTQSKIMADDWDYVVFQEQSQQPIIDESNFFHGAENLKNLVKQFNPCATPMLYMTWGRKNGDPLNCVNIPVMCSYEGMDTALKNAYLGLASYLRTEVSPVSVVWKYLRQNYPNIELYQIDESHPSAAGSYAAACSFYATIFKKDPTLITFNYNLNPVEAAIIRNAAKINVYDNLSTWDYKHMPIADFTYTIGSGTNEVIFNNTMQNVDTYLWDFGDGTTSSTVLNPTHSYTNNGTYTITLTTSNCDLQGEHQSTHSVVVSFCLHTPTISPEILTLCLDSSDTIWTEPADSYQWYDNGIPIPGATNQSLEVSLSSMGIFNINSPSVETTINGCSELSKTSQVKRHQWSEFGISFFSLNVNGNIINDNQVCNDETLSLEIYFDANYISQWYKDDIAIPFANNDTLIVNETGTYKVRIDHPSCPNMGFFSDAVMEPLSFEFIDCSLGNIEFPNDLIIFPNPAQNILNIQTQQTLTEAAVYNMLGKKVTINQLSPYSIDVSSLAKGMYIIKFRDKNDRTIYSKFIKE